MSAERNEPQSTSAGDTDSGGTDADRDGTPSIGLARADTNLLKFLIQILVLLPSLGTILLLIGALSWAVKLSNAGLPWRILTENLSVRMLVGEGLTVVAFPLLVLAALCLAILAFDPSLALGDKPEKDSGEAKDDGRIRRWLKTTWKFVLRPFRWINQKLGEIRFTLFPRLLALVLVLLGVLLAPVAVLVGSAFLGLAAAIVFLKVKSADRPVSDHGVPWTMLCAYLFLASVGLGIIFSKFTPLKTPTGEPVPNSGASLPPSFGILTTTNDKVVILYPCGCESANSSFTRSVQAEQVAASGKECSMGIRSGTNLWNWVVDSLN